MSKSKFNSSVIIYHVLLVMACTSSAWILIVDILEIRNRWLGVSSYFSQRTWLSDRQSIIYLAIWAIVLGVLLGGLLYTHFKKQAMKTLLFAGIILLLVLCSFYIDSLFYNPLL